MKNVTQKELLNMLQKLSTGYLNNPDEFVRTFIVTINGKRRHIITYANNNNGHTLRAFHETFDMYLRKRNKSADSSYAYKKGESILTCLDAHMKSSVFLKSDIHAYFDSIDFDILANRMQSEGIIKNDKKIKQLLELCFYKGKMPIGFVTSPVLSDIYLSELDRMFENKKGIVYSRYADDFIVSSNSKQAEEKLSKVKDQLETELAKYKLSLNERKTYIRTLKQEGDAIHLLGLNLVYVKHGQNRITVSDKYIRETSIAYCELLKKDKTKILDEEYKEMYSQVMGKIAFIHMSSPQSEKKLYKMLSVKLGREIDASNIVKLIVKISN